jgi:hypothetical protein
MRILIVNDDTRLCIIFVNQLNHMYKKILKCETDIHIYDMNHVITT